MSGTSPAERKAARGGQGRGLGHIATRAVALAVALFAIIGPLSSLVIWSLAERWNWPSALPQIMGLRYWSRMLTGDFLIPFQRGVVIAVIVTGLALVFSIPLGYALARFRFPGRTIVLLAFLLPQAFPQLPVFASATREFYRFGLAGTMPGVILIHLVGALVFAVWTMTAVFRSIPLHLEEAAMNLGASLTRTFVSISLPLAIPGVVASALLVFLYSLDEFTGTLLIGAPFITTLPVYMYTASVGYELQIASVTALVLMVPGAILLLLLERFLKAEYLAFFGQL
jgi:putative spermidine/putrescine transport system permease protein